MLRLIIAFLFLAFSSVSFASKTYYYYSSTQNTCSAVPDTLCTSLNTSDASMSLTYSGQYLDRGNDGITCGFNRTLFNYYGMGQHLNQTFSGSFPTTIHGVKNQQICADNEQFVLDGCTAKCVLNDPCADSKDQEKTLRVQCGIMACQQGAVIEDLGSNVGMACSSGTSSFYPSEPPLKIKQGDCEWVQSGAAETPQSLADVKGDSVDKGGQNAPTYCTVSYKSTGRKFPTTETPPTAKISPQSTGGLKFVPNVAAPNPDGGCNEGWTLGEYGSGTNLTKVCAAPYTGSGSGNGSGGGGSCTITGQTQVNGVCSCPSGQTVQNGACSSGGGGGGTCTITGQTQVNGVCSCPSGQTVQNGACSSGGGGGGSTGSGTSSDSCSNAPSCSGDPLQCASLEQIWKSACQQTKALTEVKSEQLQQANDQITAANEDLKDKQDENNTKAQGFFADFQSKATASTSAQCMPDMTLAIMGKQLIIPFSKACDFFRFLRVLVIFSAYMLAARIVFGGLT